MSKELADFQEDWVRIVDKAMLNYNSLTLTERVWFNVESLIIAADNGGLISYYYNSCADYVFETIDDLRLIGSKNIAEILERINSLFPNSRPSKDEQERNDAISNWNEEQEQLLEELDVDFCQNEKELEKSLIKYIIQNNLSS